MSIYFQRLTCRECQKSKHVLVDPNVAGDEVGDTKPCGRCQNNVWLVSDSFNLDMLLALHHALMAEPMPAGKLARKIGAGHADTIAALFELEAGGLVERVNAGDDQGCWRWVAGHAHSLA